jgi:DNA polymerase-3 subunit gamma/tau
MMAAEMAVIRLTHVADLPTPEDLVRKLREAPPPPPPAGGPGPGAAPPGSGGGGRAVHAPPRAQAPAGADGTARALAEAPEVALARYTSFPQVVELIRANRDVKLLVEVETTLRLVHYAPGRIEFAPTEDAPRDLAARLAQRLQAWTGVRWGVSVTSGGGAPTIAEVRDAEKRALEAEAEAHPMVQAVLTAFPKARIAEIRTPKEIEAEAAVEALPEVDEEWDPFEDE